MRYEFQIDIMKIKKNSNFIKKNISDFYFY